MSRFVLLCRRPRPAWEELWRVLGHEDAGLDRRRLFDEPNQGRHGRGPCDQRQAPRPRPGFPAGTDAAALETPRARPEKIAEQLAGKKLSRRSSCRSDGQLV